jgi:DNA-binding NarL/FixJ family response regulator
MSDMGKPESSKNRPRVLLADDHPLVLERVTVLLQSTFEVVGVAHDGLEMVDKAMRLSPHIIVADIAMPKLDGIQAAHRLKEMGAKAPIVFLTSHESPQFVEACLAGGALGFVLKAQMKAELIPAVNAALSGQSFVGEELVSTTEKRFDTDWPSRDEETVAKVTRI